MRKLILILSVILLASIYNVVEAAPLPTFEKTVVEDKQTLVLNGMGMRYATIFNVKVYRAALYLAKKETSAEKILASEDVKKLDLIFMREVDKEKIQGGWIDGFKNNKVDLSAFTKEVDLLLKAMETMGKNKKMTFVFKKESVAVKINEKLKVSIKSSDFSKKLLLLWLGVPPNEELKSGLLGKKS